MDFIYVIVNDGISKGITCGDEDSDILEQHAMRNVLDNNTNILLHLVDINIENVEGCSLDNRGPSSRTQKIHPIENVIGKLNEGVTTQPKEPVNYREMIENICYISKCYPK